MKYLSNKFIGAFVNEMYAILLAIGIGNVLFKQDINQFSLVEIIMGLFVIIVILIYWWDWTEFISKKVVSSKLEFALDFLILINLELLFIYFKTPKHLALVFIGLSVLDFFWVLNFSLNNTKNFITNTKQWYFKKTAAILIFAITFVITHYFLIGFDLISGLIIILSFVCVRRICFKNITKIKSYVLETANFQEYKPITEINNSYLNPQKNDSFIISKLNENIIQEKITSGHQFFVLKFVEENQILAFIELYDSVSTNTKDKILWDNNKNKETINSSKKVKYIERVVVNKNFQRAKIGTALYNRIFEYFNDFTFYSFVMNKPYKNNASILFHKNLGFKKAGIFECEKFNEFDNYQSLLFIKTPSDKGN